MGSHISRARFYSGKLQKYGDKMEVVENEEEDVVKETSDWVEGTYSLESSSNFDSYLKELGVGFLLRQVAQVAQPTVTVDRASSSEEEVWKVHTSTMVRDHTVTFQLGEEVEDTTLDGRRVASTFTQGEGNQLVEEQVGMRGSTRLVRTFHQDRMEVTMQANLVTANSVFRRTAP